MQLSITAADLVEFQKQLLLKRKKKMSDLQDLVVTELTTSYEFTMDEAEKIVEKSVTDDHEIWHDAARAKDIAKYLASDENDV
jgi:hypothetical protein